MSTASRTRQKIGVPSPPTDLRVVVASQAEARLYDVGPGAVVTGAATLVDSKARLRDRDFGADRPGRVFDRAPPPGRRGAGAHHSTNGERSPHRHEAQVFARRVAAELEHGRRQNQFHGVILVAAPTFLGLLRAAMPLPLRRMIVLQLQRDMSHRPERLVRARVRDLAVRAAR